MIEKKSMIMNQTLIKALLPVGSTCSIKKDLDLKVGDFVRANPIYQNFVFKETCGVLNEHLVEPKDSTLLFLGLIKTDIGVFSKWLLKDQIVYMFYAKNFANKRLIKIDEFSNLIIRLAVLNDKIKEEPWLRKKDENFVVSVDAVILALKQAHKSSNVVVTKFACDLYRTLVSLKKKDQEFSAELELHASEEMQELRKKSEIYYGE